MSVPKGLKLTECERGVGGKKLPICYIPEKDPVQEALEKSKKVNYFKLTLPHTGVSLKLPSRHLGLPSNLCFMYDPPFMHANKWSMT